MRGLEGPRVHLEGGEIVEAGKVLCALGRVAMLDELGIERAVLCGHSLGAKVAMVSALRCPERVERLIVRDMAPISYSEDDDSGWGDIPPVVRALSAIKVREIKTKRDADRILERSVPDPSMRAFVLSNLVRRTGEEEGWRWRVNLRAIEQSLDELAMCQRIFYRVRILLHLPRIRFVGLGAMSTVARAPEHVTCLAQIDQGAKQAHAQLQAVRAERRRARRHIVRSFRGNDRLRSGVRACRRRPSSIGEQHHVEDATML